MSVSKFELGRSSSSSLSMSMSLMLADMSMASAVTALCEQKDLPQSAVSSSESSTWVSLPEERTAVLMMLPKMELHWKKKKKIPKNLMTIASGSDPSILASLQKEKR